MSTGFGLSTAGSSPVGFGTPTKNTQLVGPGFQQSAGGCVSSVLVEQRTRDYVYDAYGNEKPMSDTGQRMYMLCRTTIASRSGWQEFGMEIPTHVDSRTQRVVERFVRRAMRPVISDGSARLDSVEVDTDVTKILAVIRWTDLRLAQEEKTVVPLAQ